MSVAIGLDLGSETVRVAALVEDRPVPVSAFPAVIATDGDRVRVGRAALALADAPRTVEGAPAERLAWLIRAAVHAVEEAHGGVLGAVIAVSPDLGVVERRALRDAAAIAQVPAVRLVSSPVATALSLPAAPDGRWLVCEAGAGAFTASVVDRALGAIDRLTTASEPSLGGRALDQLIAEQLARAIDPTATTADPVLVTAAAALKEHIGNAAAAEAALSGVLAGADERLRGLRPPRRDELELWMAPRVRRVDEVCARALTAAGVAASDLSEVVLAGGGARLALLARRLGQVLVRPPRVPADAGFATALGAARMARLFVAEPSALVVDVVRHGLSLACGGEPVPLVASGAVLPTRESRAIATRDDNEVALEIELWEQAAPPRVLGRWRVGELPEAPAGDAVALCNITVDADGLPRLSASELVSGAALALTPIAVPDADTGLDVERIAARRALVAEWRP